MFVFSVENSGMVPRGVVDIDRLEQELPEVSPRVERTVYPCRSGTPKRSRYKKGAKRIRQDGKHRRRVRKISW